MLIKRVKNAYLFPNGNLAACNIEGHQIPELQGQYSIEIHKRILLEALDDCEFKGFHLLPNGFVRTAEDWARFFRDKNKSYKEIKEL